MRKLIYSLIAILSLLSINETVAQEKEIVSVAGRTTVERTVELFKAKMVLNMDQVYYSNPECTDLESLTNKYFELLRNKGLDPSKFVENKLAYSSYGYQKGGTVYEFETKDVSEIDILTNNKMNGIQVTIQYKTTITEDQRTTLLKKALQDARKNAETICKISSKKIVGVTSISETALKNELWNSYYNDYVEELTVYVSYEVE